MRAPLGAHIEHTVHINSAVARWAELVGAPLERCDHPGWLVRIPPEWVEYLGWQLRSPVPGYDPEVDDQEPVFQLRAQLLPHQETGARFAVRHRRVLIADDPGTGKTFTALAAVAHLGALPALVVAPAAVCHQWEQVVAEQLPGHQVDIVSWDSLHRLDGTVWYNAIILDEAHLGKNGDTRRWNQANVWTYRPVLVLALTGTPVVNNLEDLITIGRLLHILGYDDEGEQAAELVLRHTVSRSKQEVVSLPDVDEKEVWFEVSDAARRALDQVSQDLYAWWRARHPEIDRVPFPVVLETIKRFKSSEGYLKVQAGKEALLQDRYTCGLSVVRVAEQEAGRPLVFVMTRELGRRISAALGYGYIDGDVDGVSRRRILDEFRRGFTRGLVLTYAVGGVGLNLQEAGAVVLLEPPWTAAAERQAIDRVWRIGRTKEVPVYRLRLRHPFDQALWDIVFRKRLLSDQVIGRAKRREKEVVRA